MKAPPEAQTLHPVTGPYKQAAVVDALTQLARQHGPGWKFPTVLEICAKLGITSTTLQRCLKDLESKAIITRRRGSGIYVSPEIAQRTIGLVFGGNILSPGVSPNYLEILNQCALRASAKGERFSFFLDIEDLSPRMQGTPVHRDLADALTHGKLAGLLVTYTRGPAWEEWLRNQGVPMVCYGHLADVHRDREAMVRLASEALAGAGCRSVGYFGAWRDETDAFLARLGEHQLEPMPEWFQEIGPTNPVWKNRHEEFGYLTACGLMRAIRRPGTRRPLMPEGLLITDDMTTAGVCKAFDEAGIAIGRDIHIATHANKGSVVLRPWSERLIRLEMDPARVAAELFSALDALIEGRRSPDEETAITPALVSPAAPRLEHKSQSPNPTRNPKSHPQSK